VPVDATDRNATAEQPGLAAGGVGAVEARHGHLDSRFGATLGAEHRADVTQVEIPLADAVVAVAVSHRTVGHHGLLRHRVQEHGLEGCVLAGSLFATQVLRGQELAGEIRAVTFLQAHQERQVRVAGDVLGEVRDLAVDEELLEDDVAHRHGQGAVCARSGGQPLVGELDVVGVVRCHRDDLLSAVASLGHPVRIRGSGDGQVRAPHDQIARVPPVPGLRNVRLVAEDLWRRDRQVGIPVIEAEHRAADEVHEPGTGGVRDHRHRRDRREPGHAVGPPLLDGVHMSRGNYLGGFLP